MEAWFDFLLFQIDPYSSYFEYGIFPVTHSCCFNVNDGESQRQFEPIQINVGRDVLTLATEPMDTAIGAYVTFGKREIFPHGNELC